MEQVILRASYLTQIYSYRTHTIQALNLTTYAEENVFLLGSANQRRSHFEVLCGLREPDMGNLFVCGQSVNVLNEKRKIAFRREHIGGVPAGGGFFPEVSMLDQVTLPLVISGESSEAIQTKLEEYLPKRLSLADLRLAPRRSPPWKVAYAAVLRTMLCQPDVVILNGLMDEMDEVDADALWDYIASVRSEKSALLYLGGGSAPRQVMWSRQMKL